MGDYTLDPTKLFENGKVASLVSVGGGNDYYDVGNGAYWRMTEDSAPVRWMEVDYWTTGQLNNCRSCVRLKIGATIKDLWYSTATVSGTLYTAKFWLPKEAKTLELLVPQRNASAIGGAALGMFPIRIRTDQPVSFVAPSLLAKHVVIYGDSIASGGVGVCATLFGYYSLLRRGLALGGIDASVTLVSHGTRLLKDDCDTAGKRTTFAANLLAGGAAGAPSQILLAIGSNDCSLAGGTSLANFTTYYEGLMDEIHSQSASMPIKCLSPIRRSGAESGDPGGNGYALPALRTVISDAVTARGAWGVPPTYIDGLSIFADLTLFPDGTHPGTAGNVVMSDFLEPLL